LAKYIYILTRKEINEQTRAFRKNIVRAAFASPRKRTNKDFSQSGFLAIVVKSKFRSAGKVHDFVVEKCSF